MAENKTSLASATASPDAAIPAATGFDPKPLRSLAAKYSKFKAELDRLPRVERDAREQVAEIQGQLNRLTPEHLNAPEGTPKHEEVARLGSFLHTAELKLRLIPSTRKQHEAAIAEVRAQIFALAREIITEQLHEARQRVTQAVVEIRRLLYPLYGSNSERTIAVSNHLYTAGHHVMTADVPKLEAVRWLEFWDSDSQPSANSDVAAYVERLITMANRFQAGEPVSRNAVRPDFENDDDV